MPPTPCKAGSLAVILVIWSFGHNRFQSVKIRHYIKYFIFIYSEQMTQSQNENDHFDLDQNDQAFVRDALIWAFSIFPQKLLPFRN